MWAFRQSGKPCLAWSDTLTTKEYYLASACDQIQLAPGGVALVNGLSLTTSYFAGTFEKLGVHADFEHVGNFKSAVEPLQRTGPSDAASEATDTLLDSLYGRLVKGIAEGRGISEDEAKALVDLSPMVPVDAMRAHLVDGNEFRDLTWSDEALEDATKMKDYLTERRVAWGRGNGTVAVVYAEGTIVSGDGNDSLFGGANVIADRALVKLLEEVREDDDVKAVVLRVNSPGGSGGASDTIWREIQKVQGVEAGRRVDGRLRRERRLLHRDGRERDRRAAQHAHGLDRRVRREDQPRRALRQDRRHEPLVPARRECGHLLDHPGLRRGRPRQVPRVPRELLPDVPRARDQRSAALVRGDRGRRAGARVDRRASARAEARRSDSAGSTSRSRARPSSASSPEGTYAIERLPERRSFLEALLHDLEHPPSEDVSLFVPEVMLAPEARAGVGIAPDARARARGRPHRRDAPVPDHGAVTSDPVGDEALEDLVAPPPRRRAIRRCARSLFGRAGAREQWREELVERFADRPIAIDPSAARSTSRCSRGSPSWGAGRGSAPIPATGSAPSDRAKRLVRRRACRPELPPGGSDPRAPSNPPGGPVPSRGGGSRSRARARRSGRLPPSARTRARAIPDPRSPRGTAASGRTSSARAAPSSAPVTGSSDRIAASVRASRNGSVDHARRSTAARSARSAASISSSPASTRERKPSS